MGFRDLISFKAGAFYDQFGKRVFKFIEDKYGINLDPVDRAEILASSAFRKGRDYFNKNLPPEMGYRSMYNRRPVKPLYSRRLRKRMGPSMDRSSKRQRFSPRNVGQAVGSGNAKVHDFVLTNRALNMGSAVSPLARMVTDIPRGVGINERERDLINYRGIKIAGVVNSEASTVDKALYFNWAIIAPKGITPVIDTTSIQLTEFFRAEGLDPGTGAERGIDYGATGLRGIDLHMLPINTDKWTVLCHKRMLLASTANGNTQVTRIFKGYCKLDRQVQFFGAAGDDCNTPIYFVAWGGDINDDNRTAGTVGRISVKLTGYFKEPTY